MAGDAHQADSMSEVESTLRDIHAFTGTFRALSPAAEARLKKLIRDLVAERDRYRTGLIELQEKLIQEAIRGTELDPFARFLATDTGRALMADSTPLEQMTKAELQDTLASLRLALDAERHVRRSNVEYLIQERDRYRAALELIAIEGTCESFGEGFKNCREKYAEGFAEGRYEKDSDALCDACVARETLNGSSMTLPLEGGAETNSTR